MGSINSSKAASDNCNNPKSPSYPKKRRNFTDLYSLGKGIGIGSFAAVYKCFRKSDLKEFAVKIIKKRYLNERELIGLRDEIKILKRVSHKNIIKLFDILDDGKRIFIILELCDGKDLFDQIIATKHGHFTESKAAKIVYTLSNVLQYLHENSMIHRNLKPENILFAADGTLKITDFGLAHYETSSFDSIYMNTCCGTPYYVAPEIIAETQYNYKCDIWSLGVILYIMLVGHQPFNGSLNDIYRLIITGKYDLKSKEWHNISKDAKDLIQCLLQIDPKKRYSAKDIKHHPWIKKHVE